MKDSQGRWKPWPSRDKYPCKNCVKRVPGCHDRCERYNAAKQESANRKTVEREKRTVDSGVSEVKHNGYLAVNRLKPRER